MRLCRTRMDTVKSLIMTIQFMIFYRMFRWEDPMKN